MSDGTQSPAEPARPLHLMAVAGARPNFMKIAPLVREMLGREGLALTLVHTGQHYDDAMSEGFFRDLGIPKPDVNLGVGSGSHGRQTADVLAGIERLLVERPPDAIVVVGDVNSTIAAALAAAKLHIPVAHVEAGLRSGDRRMPEELNRILTDQLSDWLFTTEPDGERNLRAEGIGSERIHFVGNVMIDTLRANLERARQLDTLERMGVEPGRYACVTLHRPSNVDEAEVLGPILEVLEEIHAELPVVFPMHPRTRGAIERHFPGRELALRVAEPQGYLDFLRLMSDAKLVLTDSGGLQEETTALGVPCLTLRENTERPVTISQGTNELVGTDPHAIRAKAREVLDGGGKGGRIPELWDGLAAVRIVDVLVRDLSAAGRGKNGDAP